MQVKVKEMRDILGREVHPVMTGKVAHSVDLEKEMEILEEEIVMEKKKRVKDLEEWRELVKESDSVTAELMEAISCLRKNASEAQHTLVIARKPSPMENAEAIMPNLNQIVSGPYQGLIEPAGPSGLEMNRASISTNSSSPAPTRKRSSSVIYMEMEKETDIQRLQRRMGHEIHPISFMMAQCPPLNPGQDYHTKWPVIYGREMCGPSSEENMIISPSSPSIVSMRSSATPKHLADEYLSSSSISTPSYQPVQIQISATQNNAPPQSAQ